MKAICIALLLAGASPSPNVLAADLVVHEWGTFTSFQDAAGQAIGGINVDDEPVPEFVHRLEDLPIFTTRSVPGHWFQGAPACHPSVTLRLETPVLYFYPAPGFSTDARIDVVATFAGGWLTEFYPFAIAQTPGFPRQLDARTRGSVRWERIRLTDTVNDLPVATHAVWLAPRKVSSATVRSDERREAEKYLFYRGVGHLDAPVMVKQRGDLLDVSVDDAQSLQTLPAFWVVRVMPDGRVVYRSHPAASGSVTVQIPSDPDQASRTQIDALRTEIAAALTSAGLFEDEAQAMLETWRLSYFDSEGLRVFFLLPSAWTDDHLPLSISVPADITRVMLGRIELVSAHQRTTLERLHALPASAFDFVPPYHENPELLPRMPSRRSSPAEMYALAGKKLPEALDLYASLGRFRDALLVHERQSTSDAAVRERLDVMIERLSACRPRQLQE